MKIKSIETFATRSLCIVRVHSDDGSEGYGQCAPFNADFTADVVHRHIAPHVLGADFEVDGTDLPVEMFCDPGRAGAHGLGRLVQHCVEANYKFPWSYVCRGLAGVETAIWDLRGKCTGKPVCELLGGSPCSIPVYGSSMRRDIRPEDEATRVVQLGDEHGFRAFKVRIGKVCGHDEDQWPGRTEALVSTVRQAIGDDIDLLVDANSCYTPARAIEIGRLLEDNGVCHFEEPCPYWELEWTTRVAAALDVPVAGGEQDNDLAQWRRMIRMRAVDIVQPDICYVGGLLRAQRVAAMAHEAGLLCVPHSANRSLVSVFTLHLLAGIPNAGPFMEFSIEPSPWVEGLYEPALEVDDGKVDVPDEPGWGVTIRPEWLANTERQSSGE